MEKTYVVKQEVGISWESGKERSGGQMQSGFPSLRRFSVYKLLLCECEGKLYISSLTPNPPVTMSASM